MTDTQKLTVGREDVTALEDAADTLTRHGEREQAIRLYALALRLGTEAGWTPPLGPSYSMRVPSNVVELRRG